MTILKDKLTLIKLNFLRKTIEIRLCTFEYYKNGILDSYPKKITTSAKISVESAFYSLRFRIFKKKILFYKIEAFNTCHSTDNINNIT